MAIEKLDTASKILLATQTINYLSMTLFGVIKDYKHLIAVNPDVDNAIVEGLASKEKVLDTTLFKLKQAMKYLVNHMDGMDSIMSIDDRIIFDACDILFRGNDDTEK